MDELPPKTLNIHLKQPYKLRIDRLLVERLGVARKDAQRLIKRGEVVVEGVPCKDPRERVFNHSSLMVADIRSVAPPLLAIYHKPVGQLCTMDDPWGRRGLERALIEPWSIALHPVGRLDADTSGLLLFSRDGQLTQHLLHPKRAVERSYWAGVADIPSDLEEKLHSGVRTSLGLFTARLDAINQDCDPHAVRIAVTEGKHRMVRRMLHNAGASVITLKRVQYGSILLGDLAEGHCRPLSLEELSNFGVADPWNSPLHISISSM